MFLEMDSVAVTVPLRQPTKKMKKRKELDALLPPNAIARWGYGKRSFQLVTDSSDDWSEYWNASARTGRKCRGGRSRTCPGFLKAFSAFLACASVLATASFIWLFIDVRQQLTALRSELDQVIAGSEGVPDALQKCHSLSRDLQNNQTIIFNHLSKLKLQINNFTIQLAGVQHELHKVQGWFEAAPELAHFPTDLKDLSSSVASFGSQIQDLGATVNRLKETNAKVQDAQTIMQQNITSIKHSILELSNVTQKPQLLSTNETKVKTDELSAAILHLTNNFTHANETLTKMIQWITEDQKQDHKELNSLLDTTQSINMKVISLGRECAKMSEQTTILASVQKLTDQVKKARDVDAELTEKLKQLENSYNALRNSTSLMLAAIPDIQNQQDVNKGKVIGESVNTDATTEREHSSLILEDTPVKKPAASKVKRSNVD